MTWYLLKTWVGREEELVDEIRRTVPPSLYEDAFVIRAERIWRRQGRSIVHRQTLFGGCVFLTRRETGPLWERLARLPVLAKWMALGYLTIYPLMEKDAAFLQELAGEEHIVRLSYVLRERGMGRAAGGAGSGTGQCTSAAGNAESRNNTVSAISYRVSGPLECCLEDIVEIEFRKRYAKLSLRLWGEDMTVSLGIILNEDMGRGLLCDGIAVPVAVPEDYTVMEVRKGTAA